MYQGKVTILKTATSPALADINRLTAQLALGNKLPPPLPMRALKGLVAQRDVHLFVFVLPEGRAETRIVGMLTVYFVRIPSGYIAWIEDVVVDSAYRQRGIGRILMEKGIGFAEKKGARHISLRTNPVRADAMRFYERIGFKKMETIFYRINLPRGEKTNST